MFEKKPSKEVKLVLLMLARINNEIQEVKRQVEELRKWTQASR